jgi:bacteriorhodopsin
VEKYLIARLTGYYGFWIWSWLLAGYYLIWTPRRYASALGRDIKRIHIITSGWVWFLWMLYPACWGISEGGNVISPNSEFIFYGILDCHLIPITSALFLALHWKIDPARLGLRMRSYDDPIAGIREVAAEKPGTTNGHNTAPGTTNWATPPADSTIPSNSGV